VQNGRAFSTVQAIAENDEGIMGIRERQDRRQKLRPEKSSAVSDRIDKAQRDRAPTLDLSLQNLTKLPEAIGQLTQLQWLDLFRNGLTALPEAMRHLRELTELYLHENNALGLPAEVLRPPWTESPARNTLSAKPSDILEYYFRIRGGRRPLNEAKLILVGRGAVGKTSVVNRLVHDRFFPDEQKTDGIRITEWPLRLNRDEHLRLNIWDFGGQEIMHATHQFFLTERSLYLLVLTGREGSEDADAQYWLKFIDSFGAESPIIVALNKINVHPFDLNRRGLQQKYPAIGEFIKTDCEDGAGLEQLRKAIERETDRLEHLRDAFPTSWFTIKDQLAGMENNYLSFDEYRMVFAKLGEKDPAAQEALAFSLHILGIALNYNDDPRLQDTHVLNPHWVTNGIYKILNSEQLEEHKGEI
jgi:internalin A